MSKQGEWGGRRVGAGRKPTWKSGLCKAIKIPLALVDEVLSYARHLDGGHAPLNKEQNQDSPPTPDQSWTKISKLIEERQEQRKQKDHLEGLLAKERRALQYRESEIATLKAQLKDARSILSDALLEHRKGIHKGIRIQDVKSALIALGEFD